LEHPGKRSDQSGAPDQLPKRTKTDDLPARPSAERAPIRPGLERGRERKCTFSTIGGIATNGREPVGQRGYAGAHLRCCAGDGAFECDGLQEGQWMGETTRQEAPGQAQTQAAG